MSLEGFYRTDTDRPLQQGDIILAPIGRLAAPDAPVPGRWRGLDQDRHRFGFNWEPELRPVDALVGFAPAMLLTHDCHLDKEMLDRYHDLRSAGMPKAQAQAAAEADPDLDRFVVVAPLLPLPAFRAAPEAISSQRVIGLFGVPALPGTAPASAADLTFRVTIDRNSIVTRVAVLGEDARTALRYALARVDALRTPVVGFQLEAAVGKRIRAVRRVEDNPLLVELELSDGSVLRLVQQPPPVAQTGPRRSTAPGRR